VEVESSYLSLQEATKYCGYSQEYLALRARQGKLKAIKFGRNWVTRKEWLKEYLEKVGEYNDKIKSPKFVARGQLEAGGWSPPENLPIEEISNFQDFVSQKLKTPALRLNFVTVLVFILLTLTIMLDKESFRNVFEDSSPFMYVIGRAGDIIVEESIGAITGTIISSIESFSNVGESIKIAISARENQTADIGGLFKEYGQWLSRSYFTANDFIERKLQCLLTHFE